MRNFIKAAFASGACFAVFAVPAQAARTIGETFDPTSGGICTTDHTYLQTAPPQYTVPVDGVITAWSYQAAASPPQLKLKVARSTGEDYAVVGGSVFETPAPNTLNTFSTRIEVEAGNVIGLTIGGTEGECFRPADATYEYFSRPGDPFTGTGGFVGPSTHLQLDISAKLEPDCDNDGLGDETQDGNGSDSCDRDPPQTRITKDAPKTTDDSAVKFKFRSDEAGSRFECKLDRKRWKPCDSPKKVKRLDEGRHKFRVRAIDVIGNVDPTPAKDKFKVVE